MTAWDTRRIDAIGAADELRIAPRRADGTLAAWVPIWVVRVGDELFVRSYRGDRGGWFRTAARSGAGRIRVAGTEEPARFALASGADRAAIDAAYRTKYGRYGDGLVGPMTSDGADAATLRVLPGGDA